MSNLHSQLRVDSPNALPFLMIRHPPSSQERQSRAAEWVLATWMGLMDSSIMGVRRVDDEKNGQVLPMVHIAIPLAYQRKQLAETLELEQIKDEQNTPRVNLSSSVGFAEPHSFIRVPLEIVLDRFFDFMLTARKVVEINDQTLSKPEDIVEEFFREVREDAATRPSRGTHAIRSRDAARRMPSYAWPSSSDWRVEKRPSIPPTSRSWSIGTPGSVGSGSGTSGRTTEPS